MPLLTVPIGIYGPIIKAVVGVSAPRASALKASGKTVPAIEIIDALIDTGATGTVLDVSVIKKLNLEPTGVVKIHTPSTGPIPHDCIQYDIAFGIIMPQGIMYRSQLVLPIIESDFSSQHIQALIGRDIISTFAFWYNGPERVMSLAF